VLNLGAHFSISGGLHKALSEAALLECRALQIFTHNQNRWKSKPLTEEGIALFKSERVRLGIETILAHDSYLINLGSPESILSKRSLDAFIEEIERAELLDIQFLVFHPGSHMGSGEAKCVERIAQALNRAIETHSDYNVTLLLENTAGQGTSVGWRFEHLGEIISMIDRPERMGVCFDTSHAFAAGYELRTEEGYENTWEEFDRCIGLEKLGAFHLNDSKKDLGSRVDRHEHIGHGYIGSKPF
jgi:deoxyribonuclease-4